MSLADATANLTTPYVCEEVPRRWTHNITYQILRWIGDDRDALLNASAPETIRSWQLTMLLSLHMAAYVDFGISCELQCVTQS